jgi:hypothetical protein
MMRLVRRIAAVSLVLLALAASGVAIALPRSGGTSTPITHAEADAFAQAVNLTATDLPGATALQGAIFGADAVQYEALRCGRRGDGIATVGGGESWLSSDQENVASIVAVVRSRQLARGVSAPPGPLMSRCRRP